MPNDVEKVDEDGKGKLEKIKVVLDWIQDSTNYIQNTEDEGERIRLTLHQEDYDELGKPEKITVSIVPGDTLNG